jgi:transcriptional regulator with XRE-family HTH domain
MIGAFACPDSGAGDHEYGAGVCGLSRGTMPQKRGGEDALLLVRMRKRLRELGWTHERLGEEIGESRKQVQRWLSGAARAPAEFVAQYAAAVPVNPVWLLTGDGEPAPVPEDARAGAFAEIAAIVDRVRSRESAPETPSDEAAAAARLERRSRRSGSRGPDAEAGNDQSAGGDR